VTASQRDLAGKRVVVLHNEETGKFFHLGAEESIVAALLDGGLDITEVAARMDDAGIVWSPEDLKTFVTMLVKSGLASIVRLDGQESAPVNHREPSPPRTLLQIASVAMGTVLNQRIPLGNADSLASRLLPWLQPAYTRNGLALWAVLIVIAGWVALEHKAEITAQCRQLFSPESWPLLACVGLLVKVVHEIGHAVSAKRQGVRIGSVGVTLFMLAPLAYVDVTNAWKLSGRWSKFQIALGGVYLESWLAIGATFLFAWLDDGFPRHLMAQIMLIAGPATWFINANPLLRLDGYYALSDATDIPNLRMHGRNRWDSMIDHWLLGGPLKECHLVGWRRPFATIHAAASAGFQCIWMTGIIVAVSTWANAIGMLLAAVAFAAWVVVPTIGWWTRHWNAAPTAAISVQVIRRRMKTLAGLMLLLVTTILSARNPFAHGVPVIVQHRAEQVGRAASDGFVTAVLVQGNQYVSRGDLLVEITDENLVLKRDQMNDELALNMAKYRQLQSSGRLAEADAANETAKQLRQSIDELNQLLTASRIFATRDGIVVSEQPEKWLGRYAKRGEVLVRVADPNDKELLVAIKEGDFSAYNQSVKRDHPLAARIRGGTRLQVEPASAQPRFSSTLPHKALAATNGGDIPVTPDAKSPDGVKPAVPMGEATAAISPAQSLAVRAGQRGLLYLDDDQTIYSRLKQLVLSE
jgi:putative peptide zinc metalloprotease protein